MNSVPVKIPTQQGRTLFCTPKGWNTLLFARLLNKTVQVDLSRFLRQENILHPRMVQEVFKGWSVRRPQSQTPLNEMLTLCEKSTMLAKVHWHRTCKRKVHICQYKIAPNGFLKLFYMARMTVQPLHTSCSVILSRQNKIRNLCCGRMFSTKKFSMLKALPLVTGVL